MVLHRDDIAAVSTGIGSGTDTVQQDIKSPYEQMADAIMTIIQVFQPIRIVLRSGQEGNTTMLYHHNILICID